LRQHGTLTCGLDLEGALVNLERAEHIAEVFWRAHALKVPGKAEARPRQEPTRDGSASG